MAFEQANELEAEWPLVLPPVLSFLDDYSAHNKLTGTTILDKLLPRVESSLLIRTGVGKVIEKVSVRMLAWSVAALADHRPGIAVTLGRLLVALRSVRA